MVHKAKLLASNPQPLGDIKGIGPLYDLLGTHKEVLGLYERIISIIIGVMTIGGGLYFLFMILSAAYEWMNAGGDKAQLQKAQLKILNSLIGLTIVVAAYAIVGLAGYVLGFSILNPASILEDIWS
ncbi:hypothetical protein ACFLZP_00240 [Patescibacteria group bacterium]